MSNSSIWPIERILLGFTNSGQSGPGGDSNEGILRIPLKLKDWNLTIRLFNVISGYQLKESYPSSEMQSVYSTDPAHGF